MTTAGHRGRAPGADLRLGAAGLLAALAAGALAATAPRFTAAGALAGALAGLVAWRPLGGVALAVGATPLVVGIDRGTLLPLLRPSEALLLLVAAGLACRGAWGWARGAEYRLRTSPTDRVVLALAVLASGPPLLSLWLRAVPIERDDVLYCLQPWKYLLLYAMVRVTIRGERDVRRMLLVAFASAAAVALVGLAQVLGLPAVGTVLSDYYAPFGEERAVANLRATSTLASSLAMADVASFAAAIGVALLAFGLAPVVPVLAGTALLLAAAVAAGQFSGLLIMATALIAVGVATGRLRALLSFCLPGLVVLGLGLWPVLARRLSGFETVSGMPRSWEGRLENLRVYFLPELADWRHWLAGVRPAARTPALEPWREYVFIESGHVWLAWTGGVPLLAAFVAYLYIGLGTTWRAARARRDAIAAAAAASFAALCGMAVGMVFDPHLTLRGAAELSFALLALAQAGRPARTVTQ